MEVVTKILFSTICCPKHLMWFRDVSTLNSSAQLFPFSFWCWLWSVPLHPWSCKVWLHAWNFAQKGKAHSFDYFHWEKHEKTFCFFSVLTPKHLLWLSPAFAFTFYLKNLPCMAALLWSHTQTHTAGRSPFSSPQHIFFRNPRCTYWLRICVSVSNNLL